MRGFLQKMGEPKYYRVTITFISGFL